MCSHCSLFSCHSGHKATWFSSGVILANVIVGAGLLNFPAAYHDAGGILSAVITQTVCIAVVTVGMFMMAYCADRCGLGTYQDVVRHFCGSTGHLFCNIAIVVHNWGTCITMLVILADQIDSTFYFAYGPDFCKNWYMRRSFTLSVVTVLVVLPFCFPKRMETYKFVSIIGILATSFIVFLTIAKYYNTDTSEVILRYRPKNFMDIFKVIPAICFSFEAHIEVIPLYAEFRKRTLREFIKSISLAYAFCILVYTTVGVYGYLTFGQRINTDMLTSYTHMNVFLIVGMIIMALKSVTSYPVVFFCARLVLDDLIRENCEWAAYSFYEFRRRVVIIVVLVGISLAIALVVPNIGSIIAILGGTASLFIFVFPGLTLMNAARLVGVQHENFVTLASVTYVVFGVFLGSTTTVQSIQRFAAREFSGNGVKCSLDTSTF